MRKTAFTLLEILTALIIVAILTSISIISFQKATETADARLCEQNQKVLETAIEIFALENDSLPITLTQLSDRQIYLAYQKVVGEPKENKLLAFITDMLGVKSAIAQTSLRRYYGGDRKVLRCPKDNRAFTQNDINNLTDQYVSYELNTTAFSTLADLTTRNVRAIIYDKDTWHRRAGTSYAIGISPLGIAGEITEVNVTAKIKIIKDCNTSGDTADSITSCKTYTHCREVCHALQQ